MNESSSKEKYISTTPSIKNLIKDKLQPDTSLPEMPDNEEDDERQSVEIRENKFTNEQLLKAYKQFVDSIKTNKPRLFSSLNTQQPKLIGTHIVEITLANEALHNDFIKNLGQDMIHYLRNELMNDNIMVEVIIAKQKEHNKLYTAEEKFKHLASKNPALGTLKKKLDLDFE